jgi:hypothetical protein
MVQTDFQHTARGAKTSEDTGVAPVFHFFTAPSVTAGFIGFAIGITAGYAEAPLY